MPTRPRSSWLTRGLVVALLATSVSPCPRSRPRRRRRSRSSSRPSDPMVSAASPCWRGSRVARASSSSSSERPPARPRSSCRGLRRHRPDPRGLARGPRGRPAPGAASRSRSRRSPTAATSSSSTPGLDLAVGPRLSVPSLPRSPGRRLHPARRLPCRPLGGGDPGDQSVRGADLGRTRRPGVRAWLNGWTPSTPDWPRSRTPGRRGRPPTGRSSSTSRPTWGAIRYVREGRRRSRRGAVVAACARHRTGSQRPGAGGVRDDVRRRFPVHALLHGRDDSGRVRRATSTIDQARRMVDELRRDTGRLSAMCEGP